MTVAIRCIISTAVFLELNGVGAFKFGFVGSGDGSGLYIALNWVHECRHIFRMMPCHMRSN